LSVNFKIRGFKFLFLNLSGLNLRFKFTAVSFGRIGVKIRRIAKFSAKKINEFLKFSRLQILYDLMQILKRQYFAMIFCGFEVKI